jgi:hypothetical protein
MSEIIFLAIVTALVAAQIAVRVALDASPTLRGLPRHMSAG